MNFNIPPFKTARALVIGDVMLDRYWHGDTSRISPEAPVPVVHIKQNEERAGGASNVALNISSLGSKVQLLGIVGTDEAGTTLQKILENNDVKCVFHKSQQHPTITKLRILGRHQQLIRLDFEEEFKRGHVQPLIRLYELQLENTDVVIISDYGKGIIHCVPELIQKANALNIPVLVDPKGTNFSHYKNATVITPNLHEFEAVAGKSENNQALTEKALDMAEQFNFSAVLITKGAAGMSLVKNNANPLHIPTNAREVYDVTGAGDTVIATLGASLASGTDLGKAAHIANLSAGIVVGKLGTATTSRAELRRAIRKQQESWLGIINEENLLQEIKDAKEHNETIVMTNGCFDILHAGHITYLEQAKALGSRLIVAVNSDDSVRRLKGNDRPINSLQQRMAVLASLRAIDWVVPFSEDTPSRLISAITPNILVKGGDYQPKEIAGHDHVIANGGEVKVLSYIDDHSTTSIINRLKEEQ